jgi:hypothetical protein
MTQEQLKKLEDNLWSAADKLRAERGLFLLHINAKPLLSKVILFSLL